MSSDTPDATSDASTATSEVTDASRSNTTTGSTEAGGASSASEPDRETKAERIRRLLATEGGPIGENTRGFNEGRYDAVETLDDYEERKREARAIKEDAIERLPELIEELRASVEAAGGHVYVAENAADANRYVREVCDERDADRLVKSKSMTSEEIEVNETLREAGVDVVETDLGEWVLQLAEETPSHIVAPAIHKSREEIAQLFAARFDPDEPPETAGELTAFARDRLGELIADADVGMTGANFVTTDGTLALVTSEGNARKTVGATDTQIAVAGVEKLVPSVADLQPFVELIGRCGTGQEITSYISLLQPPLASPVVDFENDERIGNGSAAGDEQRDPADEANGATVDANATDREFHLVLVDNGRMALREDDDLRETLYCIRCSACSNTCANFQAVGGHAFGGETYSGGIATGWETAVGGEEATAAFNDLCTGCSRCVPACPVGIDIPWINTVVRDRLNAGDDRLEFLVDGLTPDAETDGPTAGKLDKRLFGNVETLAKLGSATAPVSNWLARNSLVGRALDRVAGVDERRTLPPFARTTFLDWANERTNDAGNKRESDTGSDRRVVCYPDLYTNYMHPARGRAAVRALEALGVEVVVPDAPGSGRAPLSQGMIDTAREKARAVAETLEPHVADGDDVVVIEPSDLAMFRGDYERLLDDERFDRLAESTYGVMEYVYGLLANGAEPDALATGSDRVAYHRHCQSRTMETAVYTTATLEACGYTVETTDAECCGMAGSFGYKRDYYELSMAVGQKAAEQVRAIDADRVVATGTSCQDQLSDLLGTRPPHPIELVAPE